jgi:glycosyltransferase involved in cell wall biosynthesis
VTRTDEWEIVVVSSGHAALDHRVFDKEACALAEAFPRVRVVATHPANDVRGGIAITALPATRSRIVRFVLRPWQCFWGARGPGRRLVILHDAELVFLAPMIKALTGWAIIYDVHEDFPRLLQQRRWLPVWVRPLVGRLVGALEKRCARACDGVIGVTEILAGYFAHPRSVALYNLPSQAFIARAASQAKSWDARLYDLVHLGTLSEARADYFAEILAQVLARRPRTRVLLLGARPYETRLFMDRFPTHTTVVGAVPYAQVPAYLGRCRVGLNIRPDLQPHLECAVSVKVFEYLAAGCGVVTSYLPELHRVLGAGQALVQTVEAPDPIAYADAICAQLEHPADGAQARTDGMALVRARLNWEAESGKLVQMVHEVMDERRP